MLLKRVTLRVHGVRLVTLLPGRGFPQINRARVVSTDTSSDNHLQDGDPEGKIGNRILPLSNEDYNISVHEFHSSENKFIEMFSVLKQRNNLEQRQIFTRLK